MEATTDLLNLDEKREIPVQLGGRVFHLTQQRRAIIMKIVRFINTEGELEKADEKAEAAETPFHEQVEKNFKASLPYVALMFGFEGNGAETKEAVAFLEEHLSPSQAIRVFTAWWTLNEVSDFFIRAGKVLMNPEVVEFMQAQRRVLLQETSG